MHIAVNQKDTPICVIDREFAMSPRLVVRVLALLGHMPYVSTH